ncbi:MAG: hypothetical protein HQM13_22855 [SAR324 cluster bacterium]|nr:hypothetical protein [SAR324 cluster bacterium]
MKIPAQVQQNQSKQVKTAAKPKAPQQIAASKASAKAAQVTQSKMAPPLSSKNYPVSVAKNEAATSVPRSYVMVVSSYENVSQNSEITSEAADQLGKTIENRIGELNKQARREIEELSVYKKLGIDNIEELGEEIADMLESEEEALKAFAFLKNPVFANLMESTEGVHRSFAEMMQENGEEKLLFGAIQTASMIKNSHDKSIPGNVNVRA